jgi:hypothetical protein
MTSYNLCLAWNLEIDTDFVRIVQHVCEAKEMSLLQIMPGNLHRMLRPLLRREIAFHLFIDRASDTDIRFIPFNYWAQVIGAYCVNPYNKAVATWDKAALHYRLIDIGLHTPYTIILPPYNHHSKLPWFDRAALGEQFIIKPARGSGGDGVIIGATSLEQVQHARQTYPTEKYLLQVYVVPAYLDSRAAWFRVLFCAGKTYLNWWDMHTHRFSLVTDEEEHRYGLDPLYGITTAIAHLCGLSMFSTEIVLTTSGQFLIVDYVNDQIDFRLQSRVFDGVPDALVANIAERLVDLAMQKESSSDRLE